MIWFLGGYRRNRDDMIRTRICNAVGVRSSKVRRGVSRIPAFSLERTPASSGWFRSVTDWIYICTRSIGHAKSLRDTTCKDTHTAFEVNCVQCFGRWCRYIPTAQILVLNQAFRFNLSFVPFSQRPDFFCSWSLATQSLQRQLQSSASQVDCKILETFKYCNC